MKLIVDVPSVVKRCLFVGVDSENGRKVPFNGKEVQVNSRHYGYDNAINSITSVMDKLGLKPSDAILVLEQGRTKMRRQAIFAGYKVKPEGAPEIGVEVSAAVEMFVKAMGAAGAAVACQPEVEADDVIAYFCEKLAGPKVVFSEDGDLAQLINADTMLWRQGGLVSDNPFGPFATRHIRLYKALVGDSSDCYKGAAGFGEKAWLDLLANYNEPDLDALEIMIQKGLLHELREDAAFFKPFNKVVDGAAHVYQSYALAKLRPEWVNTVDAPLELRQIERAPATDYRLKKFDRSETRAEAFEAARLAAQAHLDVQVEASRRQKVVFDIEILGSEKPVFLVCTVNRDTGEKNAYWMHRAGDMEKLLAELRRTDLTWISFNGNTFDAPLVYAATQGHDAHVIKRMADMIINGGMKPWELTEEINFEMTYFDHIDISEVAPGVRISLKTYAGRMGYPTMQDMPVHHDTDLTEDQLPMVEGYCFNDCGVTLALFDTIESDIELREEMGKEYGLDLRSKSDAQVAEAVLRKVLGIRGRVERHVPKTVRYTPPAFIQTDNPVILRIIGELQNCEFEINRANGQVVAPDFLKDPVKLGYGWYQMGVGGLHSTHDVKLYKVAGNGRRISDFDVASYYPNIMMSAGLIPSFDGDEEMGRRFLEEYRTIYERRVSAKRNKQKRIANSLKITLNGTFGKLGSVFSAFYSPDLMLAVTLTGQLNLMCLIAELEKLPDVRVMSANTDGIMVDYPESQRQHVLEVVMANATRTGFEYEETPYAKIAVENVNNYVAITDEVEYAEVIGGTGIKVGKSKGGVAKRKGVYASNDPKENALFLMKNPTMPVCSNMVVDWLREGVHPQTSIRRYQDVKDFVAIRNVKGGGVQHLRTVEVDDWELIEDLGTKDNKWFSKCLDRAVLRKSRPKPVEVFEGGQSFGRVARWYMTTESLPPICYAESGNRVPKTEGARVCMTLPDGLPADLDKGWYIGEAIRMLENLGVDVEEEELV